MVHACSPESAGCTSLPNSLPELSPVPYTSFTDCKGALVMTGRLSLPLLHAPGAIAALTASSAALTAALTVAVSPRFNSASQVKW